jgi:50S ribosomal subunit-associated GTPase HflX
MLLVFNKIDKVQSYPDLLNRLSREYPGSFTISALRENGLEELAQGILRHIENQMIILTFRLPYANANLLSHIYAAGEVLSRKDQAECVSLKVKLKREDADRLSKKLGKDGKVRKN